MREKTARRRFSREFKLEAVRQVIGEGRTRREVAEELGLKDPGKWPRPQLGGWTRTGGWSIKTWKITSAIYLQAPMSFALWFPKTVGTEVNPYLCLVRYATQLSRPHSVSMMLHSILNCPRGI